MARVATRVFTDDSGHTCVQYHSTVVFRKGPKSVILDSGGWLTPTTKSRINEAFDQHKLPFSVYQEKFKWYVRDNRTNERIPFANKMEIIYAE